MTATRDMKIQCGATFRFRMTWKINGAVVDVTGYTARLYVRKNATDQGDPVLTLTTENGGIVLGGITGTIDLYVSDEDTADITWPNGFYDFKMISPTGISSRLLEGRMTAVLEISHD